MKIMTTTETGKAVRWRPSRLWWLLLATAIVLAGRPASARRLTVPLNDSLVIALDATMAELNVTDSKIADVKALSPSKLLISGRALGQTRITAMHRSGKIDHYMVQVVVPTDGLAARLKRILPRQSIKVEAVGNTIVLTGQVDNALLAERAANIVSAHLKAMRQSAKVLNYLGVRGKQQVQLRVKFAEVSRSALRQIGVNAWYRTANRAGGLLAPGTQLDSNLAPGLGATGDTLQPGGGIAPSGGALPPVPMLNPPFVSGAFGLLFSTQDSSSFPLSIALNLLANKGLAKVLSEPTLVAFSGQEATFLSGGEFPVPIPQGLGQTGIEFKKYGVQLSFTPTVLGKRKLQLKVSVTVSDRDQTASVQIQGTKVPGLSTRSSQTTVELKNGQSFAIAGLLQDRLESTTSKVPLLGDLPVLGMLFRHQSFRRVESELVILVTAHLVHPLNPGEVPPLPGEDELSDPGNLRFFLLGTTDAGEPAPVDRGPAGPVGFTQ